MMKKFLISTAVLITMFCLPTDGAYAEENLETKLLKINEEPILKVPEEIPEQFTYDSGVEIPYPEEGVKGIYVTGHSAGGARMDKLVDLVNDTELNAMVIDVKDDFGDMMLDLQSENELVQKFSKDIVDGESLMKTVEENGIYPIARIVVFKDSRLAQERPDLSFTHEDGSVWENGRGENFVNPFSKDVWNYNIEIAKQAAKMGFKEIQFDYVRFPEGFENRADELNYTHGDYEGEEDDVQQRVNAVTDFVAHAYQELKPYGVDVSVDIFGYSATLPEAPGIGQNFTKISENVDVISSMIYPSHWGNGYFNIAKPDLEPYQVIDEYMKVEKEVLGKMEDPPTSRPWLQDFTASYLGSGNYKNYGAEEVEAQIRALADHGVNEFLLWDAGNTYTEGVDYTPGD
ncbi:GTP-binding protein [Oceanobacillus piezotolerans]|uniref:GTP-binding protein n=1 Tax=Oceanobacillus piezotolerans TaxID=2448030 RepID=A0A498DDM5_9BACI|nr:putative glycoside hydrolase [Oceanobacillus piezotolerans]RLL47067.1 GTP-binding protein [Oceanobacillus piezotolerans]